MKIHLDQSNTFYVCIYILTINSQSNTKRDHLSADKEQKNSTSNENDSPSLQKFNKTRLRRSNSSVPNVSESSLKTENNKSKSLEEDTEKEGRIFSIRN